MPTLEQKSNRLARDICKLLDVRPTNRQHQEITEIIHAEFAPTVKAAGAVPNLLKACELALAVTSALGYEPGTAQREAHDALVAAVAEAKKA
jgi:hypothetical protein